MRLMDYVRMCGDQLRRRKVVTALCAAGISIGCSAIIIALSIGQSAQTYAEKEMNSYFKIDEITVMPLETINSEDPNSELANRGKLTKHKLEIIRNLPHVVAAAPFEELDYMNVYTSDDKSGMVRVIATDLNELSSFGYEFNQGGPSELPNTGVAAYGASYGLINAEAVQSLQNKMNQNPYNEDYYKQWRQLRSLPTVIYQKQLRLESMMGDSELTVKPSANIRITSVLSKPDNTTDDMAREDKRLFVSEETAQLLIDQLKLTDRAANMKESGTYNSITVKVADQQYVEQVEQQIKKLNLTTSTNLQQKDRMQDEFSILKTVALGVGLFVLFIASISIVVAMTMSTYQRRRQIGIMKVLGANLAQIRNMFIIEAALLGLLGGLVGTLFSYWIVWGINGAVINVIDQRESIIFIPMYAIPVGIFFAIMTGILSGIYPAILASRTDALTAIKRD